MKRILPLLIVLIPALVIGAEHGVAEHGAEHPIEIPTVVWYQLINVAILVAGLVYYTKDMIVKTFADRRVTYVSAAHKSAAARDAAEKQFMEIKHRITELDRTREDALAKAHAHAEEIKQQILAESKQVSARIREEANITAQLETKKAQRELREQLLQDSVEAARMVLTKDISSNDQQKLQTDFVKSIEVVG